MKQLLIATTLLAALPIAAANAVLQFSADVNGNIFSCIDNTSCDTNPATGTIVTGTLTFGALTFLGSAQTQTTGASNTLDTTSFQITNSGATTAPVSIAVGGTDFVGPVTTLSESASGTWQNAAGSTIDNTFYADTNNVQGGTTPTGHPGVLQADSGLITAVGATDSFNFNATSSFSDANLYSLTLQTDGTLVGNGGQLTGRSQAIVAIEVPVPEPGSLAILGAGLIGLGLIRRARQ